MVSLQNHLLLSNRVGTFKRCSCCAQDLLRPWPIATLPVFTSSLAVPQRWRRTRHSTGPAVGCAPFPPQRDPSLRKTPRFSGHCDPKQSWLVVSTHLKNMLVKMDHFPRDQGVNKKYLSCHHLESNLHHLKRNMTGWKKTTTL